MMYIRNSHTLARPLVAAALALLVALSIARPVYADSAAQTRNIILGAAAAVAGVILYNNIHHKQVVHNTVVGYTRDGGTVYADGRIVYPDCTVVYTANRNGQRCAWDGSRTICGNNPAVYDPYNGYTNAGQHDSNGQNDVEDQREYNAQNGNNNYNNNNYNSNNYNNSYSYNRKVNRANRSRNPQWNNNQYSQTGDR